MIDQYYSSEAKKTYAVFIDDEKVCDEDDVRLAFKIAESKITKRCNVVVVFGPQLYKIRTDPIEIRVLLRGFSKGTSGWLMQYSYRLVKNNLYRCQKEGGLTLDESIIYIVRSYCDTLNLDGRRICEALLDKDFSPQYYSKTYTRACNKVIASRIENLVDLQPYANDLLDNNN